MDVLKFGGSSVADLKQIEKVLEIARRAHRGTGAVLVLSAHKGVTNALVAAAEAAATGKPDLESAVGRQREVARELGCPEELLAPLFEELGGLLQGISLVRELSPRSLDYVSSFGERMSTRCVADYFRRQGLSARAHDIGDLGFITDAEFNAARPLPSSAARMRKEIGALPTDELAVLTGFIGKTESGEITTVGRNGSDLTASLVAAAIGADEVQIWTDTDGVMTADPSVVPGAANIPHMLFEEAAELAYFGSRVLHPSTLLPAMESGIPVRVLNTNRPGHPGTVIEGQAQASTRDITSIAYKEGQHALTLRSTRMFGQAGFLARMFEILDRQRVVIDVVATSEVSVTVTSEDRPGLDRAMPELMRLGDVQVDSERTILAVVGRHLPSRPGLASEILTSIAEAGVNVEMLSYNVGSINLTMLVRDQDVEPAVEVLHRSLFESD